MLLLKLILFEDGYRKNIDFIQEKLGCGKDLLAVVKSNAYGLDLLAIGQILWNQGVRFFSVYHLEEALRLKLCLPQIEKIVILGRLFKDEKEEAICQGFDISIHCLEDLIEVFHLTQTLRQSVRIHFYIDTGMGSMGIDEANLEQHLDEFKRLLSSPFLICEGLLSHMVLRSSSSLAFDFYYQQLQNFKKMHCLLGLEFRYYHMDNSSAFLFNPDNDVCNMIRPGLLLHGLNDQGDIREGMRLPFSLKTHVSLIKSLRCGDKVNYNQEWCVERNMNVAVLPIGYGEGLFYQEPRSTFVQIKGRLFPVVGPTNMNNLFVDLLDCETIEVGETVFLITEKLPPSNWCSSLYSSYQFLSSLKYKEVEVNSTFHFQTECHSIVEKA